MSEEISEKRSYRVPIEWIFALLLIVPLVVTIIGSLFGSEAIRSIGGYASLPIIFFMLAAFIVNFISRSSDKVRTDRRRQIAEDLLRDLGENPDFQFSIILNDIALDNRSEVRILCDGDSYRIANGNRITKEEVLALVDRSAKVQLLKSSGEKI